MQITKNAAAVKVGLEPDHVAVLKQFLDKEIVPHLPALLPNKKSAADNEVKNRSRAFSAFAISNLCGISGAAAAKAVVDDFDDIGIDAVYLDAPTETLFFVQAKLKAADEVIQGEALAFCQGLRKLIQQDFTGLNQHFKSRKVEIESALEDCQRIRLVIAQIGPGITGHALTAIKELIADETHGEERFVKELTIYGPTEVVRDLNAQKAYPKISADLLLQHCGSIAEPRQTYFGLVRLADLVALHQKHGKALYERNIRTFLGHRTDVNVSIRDTLLNKPDNFLYLNNGVTVLCETIAPKSPKGSSKKLKVWGLSVINGAQTIASSARFVQEKPAHELGNTRVMLTVIKADTDSDFGKQVTRARNHQNPVHFSNFAALDDEQERLRRELAHLDIQYIYKAEGSIAGNDPKRITIDEAVQALAMFSSDPRYAVWLKTELGQLLDTNGERYKSLFNAKLTAFKLANAVFISRFIRKRIFEEANAASGFTRLAYRHGSFALEWVLSKRLQVAADAPALVSLGKLQTELSAPFDALRSTHYDQTKANAITKGPLAMFRNQTDVLWLLKSVAKEHYGLSADPVIQHKDVYKAGQPYQTDLFHYLVQKAPQIGGVS